MSESFLQMGEGGRLFGVLTEPQTRDASKPIFVWLSAGLVYRGGPSRMNVLISRAMAAEGFVSVRVDLTGKGDTPADPDIDYLDSVERDIADLRTTLEARFGPSTYVLCGLCSGADNAVRLAAQHDWIVGMVLLDPFAYPDRRYRWHRFVARYLHIRQYVGKFRKIFSTTPAPAKSKAGKTADHETPLDLRVLPSEQQTRDAVTQVHARGGATLAIFTQNVTRYYQHVGQLAETTSPEAFAKRSEELWWRDVMHTYKYRPHLERLQETVMRWARRF
ncbi:MAG: hypothetical protein AAGA84_00675 [Pseudomonadota bacterium]